LNRKRALNLEQVRQISKAWKIPAELLIEPYALQKNAALTPTYPNRRLSSI